MLMQQYSNLTAINEILAKLADEHIKVSKIGAIKLLYPHLKAMHDLGVNYVHLCAKLNEKREWLTVDSLRSYMSRIQYINSNLHKSSSKNEFVVVSTQVQRDSPKEFAQTILVADEEKNTQMHNQEKSIKKLGLNEIAKKRNEKNSDRNVNTKPFSNYQSTYPKYDVSILHNGLTNADLGLPESVSKSSKIE